MDEALRKQWTMAEQDQRVSGAIEREQSRLRSFIDDALPERCEEISTQ